MPTQTPLTILKIGGSVITDRKDERPRLRGRRLARISREIAEGWRPEESRLIIIHGAGSFGHPIVRRTGIDRGVSDGPQRIAMAETQRLQNELSIHVARHLLRVGVPAFPCQPSASAIMEAGDLVSMDTGALEGLLQTGLVPVLNGVPAYDRVQGCSILSGDEIAGFLYSRLGGERILHGTDVKGIYTADPSQDPKATFLRHGGSRQFGRSARGRYGLFRNGRDGRNAEETGGDASRQGKGPGLRCHDAGDRASGTPGRNRRHQH